MTPSKKTTTRYVRAGIAAIIALLLLLFAGVGGAFASETGTIDPSRTGTLQIQKLESPEAAGEPSSGLPQDVSDMTPMAGVGFAATRVPGIDLTTNNGWKKAGQMTVEGAAAAVAGRAPTASGTTDADGKLTFTGLELGLYYVTETKTPAGFVTGTPFVVALPMTNPETGSGWMYTVHVYPKNVRVDITLDVEDEDAVALGDTVTWTSSSAIPLNTALDGYRIVSDIAENLSLVDGAGGVTVDLECPGLTRAPATCPTLDEGVDYTVTVLGQKMTVDFTEAGLRKLEQAVASDPNFRVEVSYKTAVLADGVHTNTVTLYPSLAAINDDPGQPQPPSAQATTKWGPLGMHVHEVDKPDVRIPGVKFQLYASEEDARLGKNPIEVEGVSEWTTDANGEFIVNGLRFSDYVNGMPREPGDPLYREYFFVMTYVPDGWKGSSDPLGVDVGSVVRPDFAVVELYPDLPGPDPDPEPGPKPDEPGKPDKPGGALPSTGAQISMVLIGGLGALFIGWLMSRRRRERDDTSSNV